MIWGRRCLCLFDSHRTVSTAEDDLVCTAVGVGGGRCGAFQHMSCTAVVWLGPEGGRFGPTSSCRRSTTGCPGGSRRWQGGRVAGCWGRVLVSRHSRAWRSFRPKSSTSSATALGSSARKQSGLRCIRTMPSGSARASVHSAFHVRQHWATLLFFIPFPRLHSCAGPSNGSSPAPAFIISPHMCMHVWAIVTGTTASGSRSTLSYRRTPLCRHALYCLAPPAIAATFLRFY